MDGNTVDMDVERGQMAENALQYDVLTRLMSDKIQGSRPPSLPNPDRRCVGESVQRLPYFQCDDRTVDASNAVASNLANADSIVSSDGKPHRAKQVVFEAIPVAGGNERGRRAYRSARSSTTRLRRLV